MKKIKNVKDFFNLFNYNKKKDFDKKTLLYVIGAMKTGTTWLWDYFGTHEQVFVSYPKEMQYFNCKYYPDDYKAMETRYENILEYAFKNQGNKLIKESKVRIKEIEGLKYRKKALKNEAYYLKYFKKYTTTEKCFTDVTPLYCGLEPFVLDKMSKLHPKTKFMFIMRDPIERYCSAIKQLMPASRISDNKIDNLLKNSTNRVLNNYKYTIENLEKVIPKANILYCFYENLFCDETIKEICDFMGIEFKSADYNTRLRSTYDFDFSQNMLEKIFDSQKDIYEFVFEKFGQKTPVKWFETYNIRNK